MGKIFENFKNVLTIILVLGVMLLGYRVYQDHNEKKVLYASLIGQIQAYEQLSKHAAKLEIDYKSQQELHKIVEKDWKGEKSALKGRIKILSNATYLIREKARKTGRSDLQYAGKKVKYLFNEIRFNDGPPVGYVMIFDDGRVVSKVYNHEIDVKTAISREEDGKYHIVSKADFVLRSGHRKPDGKNWFGVHFPMNIVGGQAIIDPTEKIHTRSKFHLFNPRFGGGLSVSSSAIDPHIGVSLMSYGPSKRDVDFKFLQVQYEIADTIGESGIGFVPLYYRPFRETFPNTYVGPGIKQSFDGKQSYFLGITLNF